MTGTGPSIFKLNFKTLDFNRVLVSKSLIRVHERRPTFVKVSFGDSPCGDTVRKPTKKRHISLVLPQR